MAKRTGPTNPYLRNLIKLLKDEYKKTNARIWKSVAERLEKPRRRKVEVNLSKIERFCKEGEEVLVPGVVLGNGNIKKRIKIYAWRFSNKALKKIKDANGEALPIERALKENPKGKNVRIIV